MCFSCMPGPQEEISFSGHPLAYIAPGSYGQPHTITGVALGVTQAGFSIYLNRRYDDPLDYIRGAKATIDRKKNSLEAIYTSFISELALKFFGIKTSSWILYKTFTNTTMCFSCMPGAQKEISFYGHPLAYLAPGSYGQP
ncbi:hypothetical protein FXO37_14114 [Capsicum annuum]|nr:hypothetical protein FXO37_14114 [Capsicum annuum]